MLCIILLEMQLTILDLVGLIATIVDVLGIVLLLDVT